MKKQTTTATVETVAEEPLFIPKDTLDAFAYIASKAYKSKLSKSYVSAVKPCTDLLEDKYSFSDIQSMIIAIIIDAGKPLSTKAMAQAFSVPNAVMMRYETSIDELVKKRILRRTMERESFDKKHEAFVLRECVRKAFCNDASLKDSEQDNMTVSSFFAELDETFEELDDQLMGKGELAERLSTMLEVYEELSIVRKIQEYNLLLPCHNYILMYLLHKCADNDSSSASFCEIQELIYDRAILNGIRLTMTRGDNELIKKNIVEFCSADGLADTDNIRLTYTAKQKFCEELGMDIESMNRVNGLTLAETITPKSLFYNERETEEVSHLKAMLGEEQFAAIQQRLEEVGMRKGFACLFFGSPGTGKTETVMQLARETGRNIMQVDLSTVRDKFVGATEMNVKAIFDDYRRLCKQSDKTPILLLNEADAIICRRSASAERAVDKMENAMQNIMLQEIEKLDGILIATTNLTENMDAAFERRFIFKIRFDRPSTDTKSAIWQSVMPHLAESDTRELASSYDLSGGQIENIVRKQTVDYVLSGEKATLEKMHNYCRAEVSGEFSRRRTIGFM